MDGRLCDCGLTRPQLTVTGITDLQTSRPTNGEGTGGHGTPASEIYLLGHCRAGARQGTRSRSGLHLLTAEGLTLTTWNC
jgi:hypothetical protein